MYCTLCGMYMAMAGSIFTDTLWAHKASYMCRTYVYM